MRLVWIDAAPKPDENPGPWPNTLTDAPPMNTARCVRASSSSCGRPLYCPSRVNRMLMRALVPPLCAVTCSTSG